MSCPTKKQRSDGRQYMGTRPVGVAGRSGVPAHRRERRSRAPSHAGTGRTAQSVRVAPRRTRTRKRNSGCLDTAELVFDESHREADGRIAHVGLPAVALTKRKSFYGFELGPLHPCRRLDSVPLRDLRPQGHGAIAKLDRIRHAQVRFVAGRDHRCHPVAHRIEHLRDWLGRPHVERRSRSARTTHSRSTDSLISTYEARWLPLSREQLLRRQFLRDLTNTATSALPSQVTEDERIRLTACLNRTVPKWFRAGRVVMWG